MQQMVTLFFCLLFGCAIAQNRTSKSLDDFVVKANCTQLVLLQSKLGKQQLLLTLSPQERLEIQEQILQRLKDLQCSFGHRQRRNIEECKAESIGDGWCDVDCNTPDKQWDDGDCCPHTCKAKQRAFECGSGGYQCRGARKIPVWFAARTQLCYKWYADGDGGQCGGGASQHLCAGLNQLTAPYRDDTDKRPGGCRMSWGLETSALEVPDWFRQMQICYRWHADGDGGQCGAGAPAETCANVGEYTAVYRDDTDRRPGGCQMSWRLNLPGNAEYWAQDISLCFKWWPDGDGGQCGGGASQHMCALAGSWTPYYRDDTDSRPGGCQMQWGIFLN